MNNHWLQHVNVKVMAESSPEDLSLFIPVFHRWIQSHKVPELLLDVADYRHVPEGPGVILVAHEAIYGFDQVGNKNGLLYNRRTALTVDPLDALRQEVYAAINACVFLEEEPELKDSLKFNGGCCEFFFNDRALLPNDDNKAAQVSKELEVFLDSVWGKERYVLKRVGDNRGLLCFSGSTKDFYSAKKVLNAF